LKAPQCSIGEKDKELDRILESPETIGRAGYKIVFNNPIERRRGVKGFLWLRAGMIGDGALRHGKSAGSFP
jgi:hypothetical protein